MLSVPTHVVSACTRMELRPRPQLHTGILIALTIRALLALLLTETSLSSPELKPEQAPPPGRPRRPAAACRHRPRGGLRA